MNERIICSTCPYFVKCATDPHRAEYCPKVKPPTIPIRERIVGDDGLPAFGD